MLAEVLLPEGGSGVPDPVVPATVPWRGWGGPAPEGFPAICCSSPPSSGPGAFRAAGAGESWELEFL